MTDKQLNGLRVAILATNGFEEAELVEPRKVLNAAGAKTTVIAPKSGKIQGMKHDEKSEKVAVDATFDSANPADFDAVLLPGGALNADALRVVRPAQQFVQEFSNADKPIAVICHAPWLLVSAGLTRGRTITSYHTIRTTGAMPAQSGWTRKSCLTTIGSAAVSPPTFPRSIVK